MSPTDYSRMNEWVQRIDSWIQQGLEEFYFFMHSPNKGLTAELSIYFINRLAKVSGIEIRTLKIKTTESSQLDML